MSSRSEDNTKKIVENEYADSGLFSGENLVSEEIQSDVDDQVEIGKSEKKTDRDYDLGNKDEEVMCVDSGVICLSENLCDLSLEEEKPNLNNLGSPRKPVESKSERENSPENLWITMYKQDEEGDTQLHLAISEGLLDVSAALIQIAPHPKLLDTANDEALTPLHIAVSKRLSTIVRLLIIAGARPGPRNLSGDSPLHIAVRLGDLDCCKAILYPVQSQEREQLRLRYPAQRYTPYDLEQWNYQGKTCVHLAAEYGHIDVLRHLIWFGADINARDGLTGRTALHCAVDLKDANLLNFLLNECEKIDLNRTNYGQRTAYKISTNDGDPDLIEMFKERGVTESPYNSEDDYSTESEDDEICVDGGSIAVTCG